MKFEVGKYYRTRDGRKALVLYTDKRSNFGRSLIVLLFQKDEDLTWHYLSTGKAEPDVECAADLVGPWREPTVAWAVITDTGNLWLYAEEQIAEQVAFHRKGKVIKLVEERE